MTGTSLEVWDTQGVRRLASWDGAAGPVTFTPDGKGLATGSKEGKVKTWVLYHRSYPSR